MSQDKIEKQWGCHLKTPWAISKGAVDKAQFHQQDDLDPKTTKGLDNKFAGMMQELISHKNQASSPSAWKEREIPNNGRHG